jgi:hypothetical protein
MADHSQCPVDQGIRLAAALDDWDVLRPNDPMPEERELAICPGGRAAMAYLLGDEGPGHARVQRLVRSLAAVEGVELTAWRENGEACVRGAAGEMRFAPGSSLRDMRGRGWELDGNTDVLDTRVDGELVSSETYPDVLGRLWAALESESTGDVLLSAAPGYEFVDWGGGDHVGGGSHGSLRAEDSLVPLTFWGCGPDLERSGDQRPQWSITDVAAVALEHFAVARPAAADE